MSTRTVPTVPTTNAVLSLLVNALGGDEDAVQSMDLARLAARAYRDAGLAGNAREVLLSWDLCPLHECDVEICRDDADPSCRSGRGPAL